MVNLGWVHSMQYGKVAIIIASVGRPTELGRWIHHIARQTLKPIEVIWSVASSADLPAGELRIVDVPMQVIICPNKGSSTQRNSGLDAIRSDPDIVVFFDDDYVPTQYCIEGLLNSFIKLPHAIGLSGKLIADGINSPGIAYQEAQSMIETYEDGRFNTSYSMRAADGLYGCNMAFRWSAARHHRFDEKLPLYGWQEDWDFSVRVSEGRPIGFTDGFVGVHLGVKGSRTSGRRFGYSQIANPIYLYLKGTMRFRKALTLMLKNMLANHLRVFSPEPWVDRAGRVTGNWIAMFDIVLARLRPDRATDL